MMLDADADVVAGQCRNGLRCDSPRSSNELEKTRQGISNSTLTTACMLRSYINICGRFRDDREARAGSFQA